MVCNGGTIQLFFTHFLMNLQSMESVRLYDDHSVTAQQLVTALIDTPDLRATYSKMGFLLSTSHAYERNIIKHM